MEHKQLTLGSLFSGSGGFELAGILAGIEPVWASEVEPFAVRVTTKRLPGMKHYGDVSALSGAALPPVDIITFGSPCQDMSIAGRRAGLDGERSGLFHQAIRIIREMREATNGEYPRYCVWENVPGAFSSNGGADFKAVLEAVIGVKEPAAEVPAPGKNGWPYADVYLGDGWSVAYRLLDAQFWGVPQRRARIFLVADFGSERAGNIQAGRKIDPTFYSVIYGAAEDEDWTDPKVWKKANPSLGITVGIDKVKAACESAKQNPGEENSFRQLRLNQWVKQSVRWMPMDKWDACAFPVNEDDLEGRVCYGGLDLSSTTDITAFVLVFPPIDDEDKYIVFPFFWIPEDNIDLRVRRDHVPYDLWERQGILLTTEGNVVHYGYIEQFIERLGERFNIREIAFDRWGAVQMVQNLEGMGFTVVPFGQGFKDMSPPTKELMKLVLERRIAHGGHPVLRWMMDNIYIRSDPAGNIKPDKEKSTEKIDGAVATVMALDRAIRCGNDTSESIYDSRGLLFL